MTDERNLDGQSDEVTSKTPRSPRRPVDMRALRRATAGSRSFLRVDGGPPTRLASGEWMQRIAIDLPEAMRDAILERAEGDDAKVGEVIRAALVAAGIGDPSHVAGIRDGTHSDDDLQTEVDASIRDIHAQARSRLNIS